MPIFGRRRDDVAGGSDARVVAEHVDAVVLGDDPRGRGGAIVRLRYVDPVEQVEADDRVTRRGEAVDDGRADPTTLSGHDHDSVRHRCAPPILRPTCSF